MILSNFLLHKFIVLTLEWTLMKVLEKVKIHFGNNLVAVMVMMVAHINPVLFYKVYQHLVCFILYNRKISQVPVLQ